MSIVADQLGEVCYIDSRLSGFYQDHKWTPRTHEDQEANANLIAAAPELLAALKQCREALLHLCHNCPAFEDDAPEFNEGGIGYEACGKAIEIINKAEGRTN